MKALNMHRVADGAGGWGWRVGTAEDRRGGPKRRRVDKRCFQWPKLAKYIFNVQNWKKMHQWPKLAKVAFNGPNWKTMHQRPKLAKVAFNGQNWQKMLSMATTGKSCTNCQNWQMILAKTGKRCFQWPKLAKRLFQWPKLAKDSLKATNNSTVVAVVSDGEKSICQKTQLMHCISMLSLVQNQAGSGGRPTLESARWQRKQTGASAS